MLFIFVDNVYLLIFVVVASLGTSFRINCTLPIPENSYIYWQKRVSGNSFVYLSKNPPNVKVSRHLSMAEGFTGQFVCTPNKVL